jgi:hypothetical protein
MPADLYGDAHGLAISLRARGFEEWADRITEDISAGATGTEIVMRLRSTLTSLAESEALPPPLREEVAQQVQALSEAIR